MKQKPDGVPRHKPLPLEKLEGKVEDAEASSQSYWKAHQLVFHLLSSGVRRDPVSGKPLPQSLLEHLDGLASEFAKQGGVFPEDPLWLAVKISLDALDHNLLKYRTKIERNHSQKPPFKLRKMDTKCMIWLARQPGRSTRGKLASRPKVLTLTREFAPDTLENRVMMRFIKTLQPLVENRLQVLSGCGIVDGDGLEKIQMLKEFCRISRKMRLETPLSELSPEPAPKPNNVLISDPVYMKIWNAWKIIKGLEGSVAKGWFNLANHLAELIFRGVAATLLQTPGARIVDELIIAHDPVFHSEFSLFRSFGDDTTPASVKVLIPKQLSERETGKVTYLSPQGNGFIVTTDKKQVSFHQRDIHPAGAHIEPGVVVTFTINENVRGYTAERLYIAGHEEFNIVLEAHADNTSVTIYTNGYNLRGSPTEQVKCVISIANIHAAKNTWVFDLIFQSDDNIVSEEFPISKEGIESATRKILDFFHLDAFHRQKTSAYSLAGLNIGLDLSSSLSMFSNACKMRTSSSSLAGVARTRAGMDPLFGCIECSPRRAFPLESSNWKYYDFSQAFVMTQNEGSHFSRVIQHSLHQFLENITDGTCEDSVSRGKIFSGVVVPDMLEEISLRPVKTSTQSVLGTSQTVWRSIASAVATQEKAWNFMHPVAPGDVLIVFDFWSPMPCWVVLAADFEEKLRHTSSKGVIWERRAVIPIIPKKGEWDANPRVKYLREVFSGADISDACRDSAISFVSGTDMLDKALDDGISSIGLFSGKTPAIVTRNVDAWTQCCKDYFADIKDSVKSSFANFELLESHLQNFPAKKSQKIFVQIIQPVQRSFQTIQKLLLAEIQWLFKKYSRPGITYVGTRESPGPSTFIGAELIAGRLREGLPLWKEWTPDLYLEVIRNGVFDTLLLLKGQTIQTGDDIDFAHSEIFTLPQGQEYYLFPLVVGRNAKKRILAQAQIKDISFPLRRDVNVRFQISYKNSLDGYSLKILPADPGDAPFKEIRGIWNLHDSNTDKVSSNKYLIPSFQESTDADAFGNADPWMEPEIVSDYLSFQDKMQSLEKVSSHILSCLTSGEKISPLYFDELLHIFKPTSFMFFRFWKNGRTLENSPREIRGLLSTVTKNLLFLATGEYQISLTREMPKMGNNELPGRIRENAIRILSRLKYDIPPELTEYFLEQEICISKPLPISPYEWARSFGRIFTYYGMHTNALLKKLQTIIDFAWADSSRNSKMRRVVTQFMAVGFWEGPTLAEKLDDKYGSIVLDIIYNSIYSIAEEQAEISSRRYPTEKSEIYTDRLFQNFLNCCIAMLGLLRMRERGVSFLHPENPKLAEMAFQIRSCDTWFSEIQNLKKRTPFSFKIDKPESLRRMSDLSFALNAFLTGDDATQYIRVIDIEDEDDEI